MSPGVWPVLFIINLWELMAPQSMANLAPRGLIGRIHVGDHYKLLHTKYISSGPHGFREEDLSFPHYKSIGANEPRGVAILGPRGLIGRIYVGNH